MWDFKRFGNDIALKDDRGQTVSYSHLDSLGGQLCQALGGRCFGFILCSNTIGSAVSYVSCLNNRIVPAMLSASIDRELLCGLVSTYAPSFIILPVNLDDVFGKNLDGYHYGGWTYGDYAAYVSDNKSTIELYPDLALLLTTSGSTGSCKFVRQSYLNIRSNAESIASYLGIDATERPITTLPMNYTYGLSIINSHLLVGASILLTDKTVMQRDFWDFFRDESATSFGGVPYTYEMLDKLHFDRMSLPSLRYMTQAGGKITTALHEKFAELAEEKGLKFFVMYGQCEATSRMGYLPAEFAKTKKGSMGIAIPGGVLSLVDDAGSLIEEANVPGELVYRGDNVTLGYAECAGDLANGDEFNGELHTGDLAIVDEDGFFYIVGRKKRFIKVYGNRVNLDEVERMIKDSFSVVDCACGGRDDRICIFVTDNELAEPIRRFLIQKTKLNPASIKSILIDEIPKNGSGKVQYGKLADYYE